jgi:signal transduction histidine kinase
MTVDGTSAWAGARPAALMRRRPTSPSLLSDRPAPDPPCQPACSWPAPASRLPLDEAYRGFFDAADRGDRRGLANARTLRGRAPSRRDAGGHRSGQDRVLLQRQPRVPHPADPDVGPTRGRSLTRRPTCRRPARRLDVAHRNALRLLKLVNSLLDFSRIEAGRAHATSNLPTWRPDRGPGQQLPLGLRTRRPFPGRRLPPLPGPVMSIGRCGRTVVLNLLSNAFKFTLEGRITVRCAKGDGSNCRDRHRRRHRRRRTGRVFERFHRIEGQKGRTHEGTASACPWSMNW